MSQSPPQQHTWLHQKYWNIVLSTIDTKYLIVYVNNLYLNNPTKKKGYWKLSIRLIPQEIAVKYDTKNKQMDGYVYVRVEKYIAWYKQVSLTTKRLRNISYNMGTHQKITHKEYGNTNTGT